MRHHEMMVRKMQNSPKIRDDSDKGYFSASAHETNKLETEKAERAGDSLQDFAAKSLDAAEEVRGPKAKITSEGGIAVKLINNTGIESIKGYIVCADGSSDFAVNLTTQGKANPIGVFYESGVPAGEEAWVVVSGIADVYLADRVNRGQWARGFTSDDPDNFAGQALAQEVEVIPLNDRDFPIYYSDIECLKYFKIGYTLEARTDPGLVRCILHFT